MTFKLTIKDVTHAVFTVLLHFPTTNNKMSEYPKFGHKFAFYSVERPRRHFFAQMGSFQSILGLKISTSTSPHCLEVRTCTIFQLSYLYFDLGSFGPGADYELRAILGQGEISYLQTAFCPHHFEAPPAHPLQFNFMI